MGHSFIGTEHLLLGLISESEGLAAQALAELEVTLEGVVERVQETITLSGTAPTGSPPFTPRAKKVLELSLREALRLGHNYIGTEHILLAIVEEGEGVAAQVLISLGADPLKVRQQVIRMLASYLREGSERTPEPPSLPLIMSPLSRPGEHLYVGNEWTASVVRAGRTPSVLEAAYEHLERMFAGLGITLADADLARVVVTSVVTNEGPGIMLTLSHSVDGGDSDEEQSDA